MNANFEHSGNVIENVATTAQEDDRDGGMHGGLLERSNTLWCACLRVLHACLFFGERAFDSQVAFCEVQSDRFCTSFPYHMNV